MRYKVWVEGLYKGMGFRVSRALGLEFLEAKMEVDAHIFGQFKPNICGAQRFEKHLVPRPKVHGTI